MQTLAIVSKLVAQLGRRIGIDGLALDATGVAALSVDGGYVMHIAADSQNESFVLYAALGVVPDDGRLAVWRRLLEYNPSAADGSSLGLEPSTGEVLLVCRHGLAGLDQHGFERAVESFMTTAAAWARELSAGPTIPEAVDDAAMRGSLLGLRA